MNALHGKYNNKGLVILGVSNEDRGKLEGWVEKKSVGYPIVQSKDAGAKYGVRAYPTYFLVGADGKVLAGPQHGHFSEDQIESALKSVVMFPDIPKTSEFGALRKASEKQDMLGVSKALTKLEQDDKLAEDGKKVVAQVRVAFNAMVDATLEEIRGLGSGPDYFAAQERLSDLAEQFKGMPVEVEAKSQLANFGKDPKIKKEISASKQLAAIKKRYGSSNKRSDKKKYLKSLETFIKRKGGTYACGQAEKILADLSK